MKRLIILTGLLATTIIASAQTEVVTGVMRGKDYGVTYALPKTQIEIEVKANKITYIPGEFSKYADRYLRLNKVSADPEEYWAPVTDRYSTIRRIPQMPSPQLFL